ncbi:MAG: MEKHLA domain-containing protein [Cyanobacteria bacterium]|nr:MEKHLA domain-containing protein [Cyanobacteriota bacterium]
MKEAAWLTPERIALAGWILASHQRAFGLPLLAGCGSERSPRQCAQELFMATAAVLAHDGSADPRLIYANRTALQLWRRDWNAMVGMPSSLTAAAAERSNRAAALEQAHAREAISDYSSIRIDSAGRRFQIQGARVWCLRDQEGQPCGQAASFESWWWL